MRLRLLEQSDIPQLRELALRAWAFTYCTNTRIYSAAAVKRMVSRYYDDARLRRDLVAQRRGTGRFLLALRGRRILGYAQVNLHRGVWELQRLYVDPSFLRQGIGSALLWRVETWMRRMGAKRYIARPHPKNALAVGFYRSRGFVREPRRDKRNSPCYLKPLAGTLRRGRHG